MKTNRIEYEIDISRSVEILRQLSPRQISSAESYLLFLLSQTEDYDSEDETEDFEEGITEVGRHLRGEKELPEIETLL